MSDSLRTKAEIIVLKIATKWSERSTVIADHLAREVEVRKTVDSELTSALREFRTSRGPRLFQTMQGIEQEATVSFPDGR